MVPPMYTLFFLSFVPPLTRCISTIFRYGQLWPVEMDQAVMCTTLALMRPSFAVVLRIEELLEAAADEQVSVIEGTRCTGVRL